MYIIIHTKGHIILMGEVHGHLHTEQLVSMPGVSPSLLATDGPQCARSGRPMVICKECYVLFYDSRCKGK